MKKNLLLLMGVIILAVVPFLIVETAKQDEEIFRGSDGQAMEVIGEIRSDYEPWFSPLWTPPSGQIESLLFSVQAAIGAGLVGYALGFYRGRKTRKGTTSLNATV